MGSKRNAHRVKLKTDSSCPLTLIAQHFLSARCQLPAAFCVFSLYALRYAPCSLLFELSPQHSQLSIYERFAGPSSHPLRHTASLGAGGLSRRKGDVRYWKLKPLWPVRSNAGASR